MQGAITHLFAGVPVSDLEASIGRITFAVTGLDALLERLAGQGIEHGPIAAYSNGVRHVDAPTRTAPRSRSPSRPMPRARDVALRAAASG